ncbi:hypothetical protein C2G38_2029123 [Gigaspora rosea]|uniref:Uncharacterized protein n=1 Tax=Gigaspora rosea TaxID=44941 RepID=A0A397W375_9GLOM|nr:hypothetical protein C2G38_2029123 [Gigaspora rosea]
MGFMIIIACSFIIWLKINHNILMIELNIVKTAKNELVQKVFGSTWSLKLIKEKPQKTIDPIRIILSALNIITVIGVGYWIWSNVTTKKGEKEYDVKMLEETLEDKKVEEKNLVEIIKKLGCSEESLSDINELEETLYKNFAYSEELSSYINEIDKKLCNGPRVCEVCAFYKDLCNWPRVCEFCAIYKKIDEHENEFIYVENHYDLPEDNIALKLSLLNDK